MNSRERCLAILDTLEKHQKAEVKELAKSFGVSEMTVRRDLNRLSGQYNIVRTYGGAVMENQPIVRVTSYDEFQITNVEKKEKIAARAASLVKNGQRIFIDAGSTTRGILNYLPADLQAVVVTNHLKVAERALQFDNISVIMLGGEMIKIANCSSGIVAEEQLQKYQLNQAFLGTGAIGSDGRLYDGYSTTARLKNEIFLMAEKTYILADSSKVNTYDLNEFGSLNQITAVITDDGIDEEGKNLFARYHANLIIAE